MGEEFGQVAAVERTDMRDDVGVSTGGPLPIPNDKAISFLRTMWLIRHFDAKRVELQRAGRIRASVHSYAGMEAVAVGAIGALNPGELVTSTHRPTGHALALGLDPNRVMAENMGKVTGYCRGRGGEKALVCADLGMLGGDTIVGGTFAVAVGAAVGTRTLGQARAVLCFFGDGGASAGAFHEGCNLAGLLKAAVVFICENNQFAFSTPVSETIAGGSVAARAAGYGFPGTTVDGQSVLDVYGAVAVALTRARAGEGPSLIECNTTHRFDPHGAGRNMNARAIQELEDFERARDPITLYRGKLIAARIINDEEAEEIEREAHGRVEEAVRFALDSPYPDLSEAQQAVYA